MEAQPESDIVSSLLASGSRQHDLHEKAGDLRNQIFGNEVFIRGVVEVSNFCRQNCQYCGMRRDNRSLDRFRLDLDQLLELIIHHRPASMTDLNIQTGEDPVAVRELVIPLIEEVRRQTNLGVSVCLGTLPKKDYAALRKAGAEFYIIKLETGNEAHYQQMQAPGTLPQRLEAIRHLAATGWNVSSGFILGLPGQTREMIVETLELLRSLPLAGTSVSPFIGGEQTPLRHEPTGDLETTLNCVALMRLASPERVIPAVSAMTLVGNDGYRRAIAAGANLATINLTPSTVRSNYLLYKKDRIIMDEERILNAIAAAGCVPNQVGLARHLRERKSAATVAI